jgi:UDP-GlcNAc:undecaprenyl-phosphate GlcNAc-1-phosphate transferase
MGIDLRQYLLIFAASIVISSFLTPVMGRIAIRLSVVDRPNEPHKTHQDAIPYLGGLAIIATVCIVIFLGTLAVQPNLETTYTLLAVLLPSVFMGIVGLIDDVYKLTPVSRFVTQSVLGVLCSIYMIQTETIGSPTGNRALDFIISSLWIVGVTNSINFFDNHDGGASGTVAISSFTLFILAASSSQSYIASLALVLTGTLIGFLVWNRNPARIYMGDAGSLFLGMLISSLLVRFEPPTTNRWVGFAIPILILAIPILDTSVAVISRLVRGISPFTGGQDHLSHRIIRRGVSRRHTALILWSFTALFAILAIVVSRLSGVEIVVSLTLSSLIWIYLFFWFFRQPHSNLFSK